MVARRPIKRSSADVQWHTSYKGTWSGDKSSSLGAPSSREEGTLDLAYDLEV